MNLIKNLAKLKTSERRAVALKILEAGLGAIQPNKVLADTLSRDGDTVYIKNKKFNLRKFERVFMIGFGKGSGEISVRLEKVLGDNLTEGFVIDTTPIDFKKAHFTLGTHPLPSKVNVDFTERVLGSLKNLNKKDLVIIVVCGGGSALFEAPHSLSVAKLTVVSSRLLNSGANISEMNVVRKHLSKVKGGGLAKHLYPAKIVNLIFSDVPGNHLSVIASGPTVRDRSTSKKALSILNKYKIESSLIPDSALTELPKDEKYFEQVSNVMMLSNQTALTAMQVEAKKLGFKSAIFSDRVEGDAKKIGKKLIEQTPPGKILLAGGETTVTVTGSGKGGRNQTLVLASLPVQDDTLILSFDSDGVDYYKFGGAIGDSETLTKAEKLKLDPQAFLNDDDSSTFFEKIGDGIFTDKLGSNVADLIMVLKI